MLGEAELVAFVATRDLERSHAFYGGILGLARVRGDGYANVYDAGGRLLRVTLTPPAEPAAHTVLGWRVADLGAEIAALRARGVALERFTGLEQDRDGVWTAPSGSRIAWFRDPDGNVLSLEEPPGAA